MGHNITKTDRGYLRSLSIGGEGDAWHTRETGWKSSHKVYATALAALADVAPFDAVEREIAIVNPDGTVTMVDDKKALVRSDNGAYLSFVSKTYKPLQYSKLGEMVDEIVDVGGEELHVETAGTLGGGKKAWVLVKTPNTIRVGKGGDDVTETYLTGRAGHDGLTSIAFGFTGVRIVCQNTWNSAFGTRESQLREAENQGKLVRFNHNGKIDENIAKARRVLGFAAEEARRMQEAASLLAERSITVSEAEKYFADAYANIFGASPSDKLSEEAAAYRRRREEIVSDWREAIDDDTNRIAGVGGTAWAAYNAITDWNTHRRNGRVDGDERAHSLLMGVAANDAGVAMRTALQMFK